MTVWPIAVALGGETPVDEVCLEDQEAVKGRGFRSSSCRSEVASLILYGNVSMYKGRICSQDCQGMSMPAWMEMRVQHFEISNGGIAIMPRDCTQHSVNSEISGCPSVMSIVALKFRLACLVMFRRDINVIS